MPTLTLARNACRAIDEFLDLDQHLRALRRRRPFENSFMLGLPHHLGRSSDSPLRLVAIGAHPDDIEIGAGGTILRLLNERPFVHVDWVVLSGTDERAEEARIGAEAFLSNRDHKVWLQTFRDTRFPFSGNEIKDFFSSELQPLRPDLVLTHRRGDAHQDHRLAAEVTWETFRGVAIAEYEIPKWEGDLGQPNGYVNLAVGTVQRKLELLMECFPSQASKAWFDTDVFQGLMRLRGSEAGGQYAEAFHCSKLVW